jgi:hypothetical protein
MFRQYLVNLFAALLGVSPAAPAASSAPASSAPFDFRPQQRDKLAAALHDSRFRFRSIGALSKAIGMPESYTVALLQELGARQEQSNPLLWGAVDVVGAGHNPPAQQPQELAARAGNPPPAVDATILQKTTLAAALHDSRFRFRTITALAESIGQPESYTVELLRDMGARQEQNRAHLWGAVDVVGTGDSRGDNRPRSYAYAGDESE